MERNPLFESDEQRLLKSEDGTRTQKNLPTLQVSPNQKEMTDLHKRNSKPVETGQAQTLLNY